MRKIPPLPHKIAIKPGQTQPFLRQSKEPLSFTVGDEKNETVGVMYVKPHRADEDAASIFILDVLMAEEESSEEEAKMEAAMSQAIQQVQLIHGVEKAGSTLCAT